MKISLINMQPAWKNKNKNLELTEQHVQRVLKIDKNIDTIVFPELALTGYLLESDLENFIEDINGEIVGAIKKIAKKYNVNIITGFIEKNENNKPYNSALVVNRQGKFVASYHKNHLFPSVKEEDFYTPGEELVLFELDGWKCGLAICMDIRFPRLFETMAHHGAEIIFIPSNWVKGENKFEMLKFLTQTRAVENQIYCAMIDRGGSDPNTEYTGSWMFADPFGVDVSETFENIYHIGVVNKERIKEVREKIPLRPLFRGVYEIREV